MGEANDRHGAEEELRPEVEELTDLRRQSVQPTEMAVGPGVRDRLLAFLGEGFPERHPYRQLVVAPVVEERPQIFMLGSSHYGPKFAAVNGLSAVFAPAQKQE